MAATKGAAHGEPCTGARDGFKPSKGNLHKTNRLLIVLGITLGCVTLRAGDDRFGFATHFEQGWPTNPDMQEIVSSGFSFFRDDLTAGNWERMRGVYALPAWDMAWLPAARANGLKVV